MKPEAVLFDLDGTLLPMDQKAFAKGHFRLLAKKLSLLDNEPDVLVRAIHLAWRACNGREQMPHLPTWKPSGIHHL